MQSTDPEAIMYICLVNKTIGSYNADITWRGTQFKHRDNFTFTFYLCPWVKH